MNYFNIVIVASGTLDTLFILKILDKFKSQNILLITERNISQETFDLIPKIKNLEILKLHNVYFFLRVKN